MDTAASLRYLLPEALLALAAISALLFDVLFKEHARRMGILSATSLAWLVLAAVALAFIPRGPVQLFDEQLASDGSSLFFGWIFLAAIAYAVLITPASGQLEADRFGEFLALAFILTCGLFFMASTSSLLMTYLAIEMVSLTSYALTGFRRRDRRSSEAALKYTVYGGVASGVMLYGMSLFYGLFGSLSFHAIAASSASPQPLILALATLFVFAGIAYKIAAVPFHMWAPDVYEGAPTPATAFFSIGPKAAGFALAIRFFFTLLSRRTANEMFTPLHGLPWPTLIGLVAVATMLLGNLAALSQTNLKRLFAYSSIAHAGYLLLGIAAASGSGAQAIFVYLAVYLAMNGGAFLCVIAVARNGGGETVDSLRGLSSRAPLLSIIFAVCLFSLTGLPPFAGFVGKYLLFAALLQRGGAFYFALAVLGVVNSAVSLVYYARILKAVYLEKPAANPAPLSPTPKLYCAVGGVFAVLLLAFGIFWQPLLVQAARAIP